LEVNKLKSEYLPVPLNGDSWELVCQDCYRLRYQDQHYQKIEATHGGDSGIEGFTKNGIVFQSYCPEKEYDAEKLYENLRDKITTDIGKLINPKNISKQKAFGVLVIKEWHFVTPKCEDSRLLVHLENQRKRVIEFKKKCESSRKPSDTELCKHFDDNLIVVLKTADDFKPEIYRLARSNYMNIGIELTRDKMKEINFDECDSHKVQNVIRKVQAIMDSGENEKSKKMVNFYMNAYLDGLEILEDLRANFNDIYIDLVKLRDSYKNRAMNLTMMNSNAQSNYSIFDRIMNEFEEKIMKEFANVITESSAAELCLDIVAGWLADCTMEFTR
jgi:hypothetical protein